MIQEVLPNVHMRPQIFGMRLPVVSPVETLLRISRRGHSVMELHLPLVVAIPNGLFVEYIPVVEPRPNRTTEAGRWTLRIKRRTRVGHSFDWDRMQEFRADNEN
jgi:hypothetical protein